MINVFTKMNNSELWEYGDFGKFMIPVDSINKIEKIAKRIFKKNKEFLLLLSLSEENIEC